MADPVPPQDPFEMFRRLWGPLGLPVPGMAVPTFDPKEVDKRLAELRALEQWLDMNLGMVRFAIQGLEVQRSALAAMGAGSPPGAPPSALAALTASSANTMLWPWAVLQQAMGGPAPGPAQPPAADDDTDKPKE